MKVLKFDVQGKTQRPGILGRSLRVFESARVQLDTPVFPEVRETKGRRILRRDATLYQELNKSLTRVGNHEIEVSEVKDSTDIVVEYLVGYEF